MFRDRADAGRQLAPALTRYRGESAVVYALPRGGVVVGVEVARALGAPLDLIVVRKIGHPMAAEYAVAAIAEDGYLVVNPHEAHSLDRTWLAEAAAAQWNETQRRRKLFLADSKPLPVEGKVAIVVDDGLATGLTMLAAIHEIRKRRPRSIVVAVPVAAPSTAEEIREVVDDVVALYTPAGFGAIGSFYENFEQISDEEVVAVMESCRKT